MMDLTFLNHYAPVWLFVVAAVILFVALTMLKLPGHKSVIVLTSIVLAIMLISSASITNFLTSLIPLLTVITLVGFFILVGLTLLGKTDMFLKPLSIVGLVISILIILGLAFGSFHTLNHMLPNSSDSGLNNGLEQFKDLIYSQHFKEFLVFTISIVIVGIVLFKK